MFLMTFVPSQYKNYLKNSKLKIYKVIRTIYKNPKKYFSIIFWDF